MSLLRESDLVCPFFLGRLSDGFMEFWIGDFFHVFFFFSFFRWRGLKKKKKKSSPVPSIYPFLPPAPLVRPFSPPNLNHANLPFFPGPSFPPRTSAVPIPNSNSPIIQSYSPAPRRNRNPNFFCMIFSPAPLPFFYKFFIAVPNLPVSTAAPFFPISNPTHIISPFPHLPPPLFPPLSNILSWSQ